MCYRTALCVLHFKVFYICLTVVLSVGFSTTSNWAMREGELEPRAQTNQGSIDFYKYQKYMEIYFLNKKKNIIYIFRYLF